MKLILLAHSICLSAGLGCWSSPSPPVVTCGDIPLGQCGADCDICETFETETQQTRDRVCSPQGNCFCGFQAEGECFWLERKFVIASNDEFIDLTYAQTSCPLDLELPAKQEPNQCRTQ